ncbi:DUF4180 domain-containing protein [Microtetraspora niveoalba]|uniref:DUF4180 domain-containing protein n=1 Tax=Microtetraspora niveoalba TaxID=46175 RepID=UPI00083271C0|nr:DUF4180 domain-containing protein [Microtetraspora niveoalba]
MPDPLPDTPPNTLRDIEGTTVLVCAPNGTALRSERDALDLIGEASYLGAEWVVVPAERLDGDFFRLRTRIAGDIAQKFVNYRTGLAVVGDISAHVAASTALRDFVRESNRGTQLWFVPDVEALRLRLAG